MRFLVLGAAAGGGLPQWNCGCPNCRDARSGHLPVASQSSLAVTLDGRVWAVLNASPDIRMQMQCCPQMHPRSLRDTPLASVLVTNGDIDHIAGLLSLREQTPFTLFGTSEILGVIAENRIFDAVSEQNVTRKPVELDHSFDILPGLAAQVFPVPGKVPLFMEGDYVQTNLVGEQTVGVRLSDGAKVAYYIPGCAEVTPELLLLLLLADADQLFFDGTLWDDDEMIHSGAGAKTGRRMGHIPISGPEGSMVLLAELSATRVYIHINNTNPIWHPDSDERAAVHVAGWSVAADGMEIEI